MKSAERKEGSPGGDQASQNPQNDIRMRLVSISIRVLAFVLLPRIVDEELGDTYERVAEAISQGETSKHIAAVFAKGVRTALANATGALLDGIIARTRTVVQRLRRTKET